MASIYIVDPKTVPEAESLEKILSNQYRWTAVEKIEDLAPYKAQKGIVLMGGPSKKLATELSVLRNIAPIMSAVTIVEESAVGKLDSEVAQHADILTVPLNPFEMESRLNRAMLVSELRHAISASAHVDEVTGLYSYSYFLKRLGEEMALAKRHQAPLTCVILTISFFETLIDSYGYGFAMTLLEQVARVIKSQVRSEDVVARLGQGEVGFLLPHSTEKGALSLTKRVMDNVKNVTFHMGDQEEHISLRAGITGFPLPDDSDCDPDTLVRYLRHALHQARCSEKQPVVLFSELKPMLG